MLVNRGRLKRTILFAKIFRKGCLEPGKRLMTPWNRRWRRSSQSTAG